MLGKLIDGGLPLPPSLFFLLLSFFNDLGILLLVNFSNFVAFFTYYLPGTRF